MSSLTVRATDTPLTLQLSPLAFPSLTSLTLHHAHLDSTSLTPLLHLPSLLHLDLSTSTYHHTPRSPLSSLLSSSPLLPTLLSLSSPTRQFWGKLDSIIPALTTPRHPTNSRTIPTHPPARPPLQHLSPCSHVSLQDLRRLGAMGLQSLVLDGSWMFAGDLLHFSSSLTGDEWKGLKVLVALEVHIQRHNGGIDLLAGVEPGTAVTSALGAFMRGLHEVEVLRLTLPPHMVVNEAFASHLFHLDHLSLLQLVGVQRITSDALAPLSPAAFLSLRVISLMKLSLSDDAIAVLVRAAPALTSLSLVSCFDLTGALFASLTSAALTQLCIEKCEGFTLREVHMRAGEELMPLPSLLSIHVNLNFSYTSHLDLPGLALLSSLTPGLRVLSLQSSQLLDIHLLAFSTLPHLLDLSLSSLSDEARAVYESPACCSCEQRIMEAAYQAEAEQQRAEKAGWVAKAMAAAEAEMQQQREEERQDGPKWLFRGEEGRRTFFAALEGGEGGLGRGRRSTERGLVETEAEDEWEVAAVGAPVRSQMSSLQVENAPAAEPVSGWRRILSCGCCG